MCVYDCGWHCFKPLILRQLHHVYLPYFIFWQVHTWLQCIVYQKNYIDCYIVTQVIVTLCHPSYCYMFHRSLGQLRATLCATWCYLSDWHVLLCVSIECYLGAKRLVQKQNNQSLLMCNRLISCEHACVCVHALYCVKGFRSYHLKSFDCELCHCTCQIVESHLERDGGGGGLQTR